MKEPVSLRTTESRRKTVMTENGVMSLWTTPPYRRRAIEEVSGEAVRIEGKMNVGDGVSTGEGEVRS